MPAKPAWAKRVFEALQRLRHVEPLLPDEPLRENRMGMIPELSEGFKDTTARTASPIDPDSTFRSVRWAPVYYSGLYALVLSDGTIFERESSTVGDFITVYLSDNGSRVVWREEDATTVVANG